MPKNSRKQKEWPEEVKEAVGDLIHQNGSGQIPEGLSRYDWKRAKQYFLERRFVVKIPFIDLAAGFLMQEVEN